jgi:ABC-type multidrug transport system ATPase subunit
MCCKKQFQAMAWADQPRNWQAQQNVCVSVQLMGPSGSGKSSLLNALVSCTAVTKGMTLSGELLINGVPPQASGIRVGYVQQTDLFYSQMTVREVLQMEAALRLPRSLSESERDDIVEDALRKLDLRGVADTIVGDRKVRGISGGERKRLGIACELISKPSLLFLDEPTTGLDAFQALQVGFSLCSCVCRTLQSDRVS